MKKIKFLILGLLFINYALLAQNEHNLVPNPSFEEMEGKLKDPGSVFLATPWRSVNLNQVDLYSSTAKDPTLSVPENKYGEEKPKTGTNYAGVSFFGYRGKAPRTYLGVELLKELKEGEQYCVKFHISMSDRSKYAVNNIGLFFSFEPIDETGDANIYLDPDIISVTNRVYNKQFSWTPVCGYYTAEGGEKHITIGNFAKDEDTEQEVVRLSRDIGGRQTYDAYYYVDDVSVIPADKVSEKECSCDQIAGGRLKTEYKSFETDLKLKKTAVNTTIKSSSNVIKTEAKEEVKKEEGGVVYKKFNSSSSVETPKAEEKPKPKAYTPEDSQLLYKAKLFQPDAVAKKELAKVADYLKANPEKKIIVQGHMGESDGGVQILDKKRGLFVKKQLTALGIDAERISYVGLGTSNPASTTDDALNRRVTFETE